MAETKDIVLIVVAHTDDEALGAGGTLARHALRGDKVYGLSMTDGVGAREGQARTEIERRAKAAAKAAKILGLEWLPAGEFPDNAMDTVSILSVTKFIEQAKKKISPTIVYTHSAADLNVDHRIVTQAVLTAFRPQPEETWKEIRAFEVPSATDYGQPEVTDSFVPNLSVSISETWTQKRDALEAYREEMREAPHTRSFEALEALAKLRGHQVGLKMAEAFQVLRKIER